MRTLSLAVLTVASLLILVTFVVPGWSAGDEVFVLLATVFPVALMALGAQRAGRLGPVALVLAILLVVLLATVVGMLHVRGMVATGPWLWGLPIGAALQFMGVFVVPLVVVPLGYAWTFDRWGVRGDELADLRRQFGAGRPTSVHEKRR